MMREPGNLPGREVTRERSTKVWAAKDSPKGEKMRNTVKKIMSLLLVLAIIASLDVPALAGEAVKNGNLTNGTYSIGGEGYSTAMIAPDETDFPSYVVVKDGAAWLITRSYAPNKYDAVWKGKRADAPEDASTADVIKGVLIEDKNDTYKNSGAKYSGNSYDGYKAVQFVIPLTSEELSAGDVYFVLRYASWYESKPLTWMGSNDQHFDFGTLTKKSDSTELPEPPSDPQKLTFGVEIQIGQYIEGAEVHTTSLEGVTYKLLNSSDAEVQPDSTSNGSLIYSNLDSSETYIFKASKEGWAVVKQGKRNAAKNAYEYYFTGEESISVSITNADDGKTIDNIIFRIAANKTVLDLALDLVPINLSIFTPQSANAVTAAVAAADKSETDEAKLQAMADAIKDAVSGLVPLDGSYTALFDLSDGVRFKIVDIKSLEVKNGKMTLHFVNGSKTFVKLFVGTKEEANLATDTDLIFPVEEATTSDGNAGFSWSVPVSALDTEIPLAAYSSTKKTFNSTGNFTIRANSVAKIGGTEPAPGGNTDPNPGGNTGGGETPADSSVELAITNNTGMFKVASASLETSGGNTYLVVALNSTGYEYLFKGTYEDAVRNGENVDRWIKYTKNSAGKYEFRIPVADGESYIPVISISKSRYDNYKDGNGELANAFLPRQMVIDRNTRTLVTGDYEQTVDMSVSSSLSNFNVKNIAKARVVGAQSSNNFTVETTLSMTDDKFDQITYPTVKDGAITTETASLSNNAFTISLANGVNLHAFKDGESFDITLREKESGKNVSAYMTINLLEKTIKITATSISSPGGGSTESKKDEENKDDAAQTTAPAAAETVKVEAKADANGTAKATVETKAVSDAVTNAKANKAESIVIAPEVTGDAKEVKVELPKAAVSEVANGTSAALVVETDKGALELPNDTLGAITEQVGGANVEISIAEKSVEDAGVKEAIAEKIGDADTANAAVAEITVSSGDEKITSFGGKSINASVSVDGKKGFAEGKKYLTLVISENGKRELLAGKCVADASGKLSVGVKVKHLSTFVVLDKELKSFADADAHWSADAVDFAVANGLMNGTSDTSFAPNSTLNRAMLVTILYRLAGKPAVAEAAKFADVAAGEWYSDAVAWAAASGIVTGKTETTFAPMENITREQFATMLMRYCKFAGIDTASSANLGAFADSASISAYAKDALAWANASGIITGRTATTIAPTGSATRGEAATMLMRFVQL
jgi:hypothetical protein